MNKNLGLFLSFNASLSAQSVSHTSENAKCTKRFFFLMAFFSFIFHCVFLLNVTFALTLHFGKIPCQNLLRPETYDIRKHFEKQQAGRISKVSIKHLSFFPYHIFEAIFNRLHLRCHKKSGSLDTFLD